MVSPRRAAALQAERVAGAYAPAMDERAVTGFLPSTYGLHFANAFPPGPTLRLGPLDPRVVGIGDASAGLCGGMALTARDLWAAGLPAPPETAPPANGSPRFQALVRRQVESLDWLRVPLRYAQLALVHGPLRRGSVSVRTATREWPRVQAEVDAGRPCLVELIRVGGIGRGALVQNHQVLAFACTVDHAGGALLVRVRVYDPNHPDADDVALELAVAADDGRPLPGRIGLRQTTGEPLLGFFRGPVLHDRPVGAWR
jgi:hypothetical protein